MSKENLSKEGIFIKFERSKRYTLSKVSAIVFSKRDIESLKRWLCFSWYKSEQSPSNLGKAVHDGYKVCAIRGIKGLAHDDGYNLGKHFEISPNKGATVPHLKSEISWERNSILLVVLQPPLKVFFLLGIKKRFFLKVLDQI